MRGYISLALIVVYFVIGFVLEAISRKHLRRGRPTRFYRRPLFHRELFNEEGYPARERALLFYFIGGAVLVVLLILIRIL